MDGMRKSVTIGDFFSNDHYGCTTIMNKAVKKNLVKKFIKLILISSWFKYTLSCFMFPYAISRFLFCKMQTFVEEVEKQEQCFS